MVEIVSVVGGVGFGVAVEVGVGVGVVGGVGVGVAVEVGVGVGVVRVVASAPMGSMSRSSRRSSAEPPRSTLQRAGALRGVVERQGESRRAV